MISIIVRSFNDVKYIRRTLEMLTNQQLEEEFEILNFDSGSTDGTLEIIKTFPQVKVFPPEGKYNPGRVLNRAVQLAQGEIIIFNNSDAVPQSLDYAAKLIAPLSDVQVGAVFGNQLSRPEATPLVKKDNFRAFGDGLDAANWRHMFSLARSAARREVLLKYPFDTAYQYSEDIAWSWRLKHDLGYKIVYASAAQVEHSHNYTTSEVRKRFYNEGIANGMIWREKPIFHECFAQMCKEMVRDVIYLTKHHHLGYLFSGLYYRYVQRMSLYRGTRDWVRSNEK
ncbi:MAG: glycosyltransferase family A protein [Victivallaceae bacterium]